MAKTHDAIKIMSGQNDSVIAFVWWDGEHIRSDSASLLQKLKSSDTEIMGLMWADGEKFFKVIPYRFSNGYTYCRKAKVDEDGAEV